MRKINTLIIDDEIAALNTLRGMLGQYCPQITIVAAARSVEEAVQAAGHWKPDLVFLDIEMPPFGSGFDFLDRARQQSVFGVIFTTAYPKYAVQAINAVQPWAYLVKPYSVDELIEAVEIAVQRLHHSGNYSIVVSDSRKGNMVFRVGDILYCEADGATTDIFFLRNNKIEKVIASRTLKDLENELPETFFCRTHHSYLVNMQHIERWERTGRNGLIYLTLGACVSISVLKMEHFDDKFRSYLHG